MEDTTPNIEPGLEPSADARRWLVWRWRREGGRLKKPPFNASIREPGTWLTFDQATVLRDRGGFGGVGFVLTGEERLVCVDIDGCLNRETGEIAAWATEIVDSLDSYTELSPSGTGMHVWVRGKIPRNASRSATGHGGKIELFTRDCYVTWTGERLEGTPEEIRDAAHDVVNALFRRVAEEREDAPSRPVRTVERAWTGDGNVLAEIPGHPLMRGDWRGYGSRSEADLALATLILRHTRDPEQAGRIMRKSLLRRGKWNRPDYLDRTIRKAFEQPVGTASPEVREKLAEIEAGEPWASAKGNARQSRYVIWRALLAAGREFGEKIPSGVRVGISRRTLAERAGVSLRTVNRNLKRMRLSGEASFDNEGRKPSEAGAIVLRTPRAYPTNHRVRPPEPTECASGVTSRSFAPLRRSLPGLPRLGPGATRLLDCLLRRGGEADVKTLRTMLGVRYPSDLTRKDRPLDRLLTAGVVSLDGDVVGLADGWRDKLEARTSADLEPEQAEVQRAQHRLDRAIRDHGPESGEAKRVRREYEDAREGLRKGRG